MAPCVGLGGRFGPDAGRSASLPQTASAAAARTACPQIGRAELLVRLVGNCRARRARLMARGRSRAAKGGGMTRAASRVYASILHGAEYHTNAVAVGQAVRPQGCPASALL